MPQYADNSGEPLGEPAGEPAGVKRKMKNEEIKKARADLDN